jgi:hypothetical protein
LRIEVSVCIAALQASAVLIELAQHEKAYGVNADRHPVKWPEKRPNSDLPLIVNFFFQPSQLYPASISDPSLDAHVDFAVGSDDRFAGKRSPSRLEVAALLLMNLFPLVLVLFGSSARAHTHTHTLVSLKYQIFSLRVRVPWSWLQRYQ